MLLVEEVVAVDDVDFAFSGASGFAEGAEAEGGLIFTFAVALGFAALELLIVLEVMLLPEGCD